MSSPRSRTLALGRRIIARQHVEQHRLASAVGPDERMDGAGLHREADAVERAHAAERHDACPPAPRLARPSPAGRLSLASRTGGRLPRRGRRMPAPAVPLRAWNRVPTMPSGSA